MRGALTAYPCGRNEAFVGVPAPARNAVLRLSARPETHTDGIATTHCAGMMRGRSHSSVTAQSRIPHRAPQVDAHPVAQRRSPVRAGCRTGHERAIPLRSPYLLQRQTPAGADAQEGCGYGVTGASLADDGLCFNLNEHRWINERTHFHHGRGRPYVAEHLAVRLADGLPVARDIHDVHPRAHDVVQ